MRSARTSSRGSALAAVLCACAVLVVVCLALASLAVLNLNLSNAAATGITMNLLAESAVAQFVSEAEAQNLASRTSPLRGPAPRPDWVGRFRNPVFPTDGEDLPGDVKITFDPHQRHYSVDNSQSENPAAACYDTGSQRSVPPFSVSLVMTVTCRGQSRCYEAILRRLWPFAALCTCGPVILTGTPAAGGAAVTVNPTNLVGDVCNLLLPPRPTDELPGVVADNPNNFDDPSLKEPPEEKMSAALIRDSCLKLAQTQPSKTESGVFVGDDLKVYDKLDYVSDPLVVSLWVGSEDGDVKTARRVVVATQGELAVAFPPGTSSGRTLTDSGNILEGNADFVPPGNYQAVKVEDGNTFTGREKNGLKLQGIKSDPLDLVKLPDPVSEGYTAVPLEPKIPRGNLNIGSHKAFYRLEKDLVLGPDVKPRDDAFVVSGDTKYWMDMSCGDRFFEVSPDATQLLTISTGAGIQLDNCTLYVNGNLDLSSSTADTPTHPALSGNNATLIVNGTLLLQDGSLDARDQGMVVYAKEIISQAKGDYHGLLIAEHGAVFYPPTDPNDRLHITGGIVVGGQPTEIARGLPPLTGLTLYSTDLTYDARYLKSLHPFGDLKLMTLRPVP